MHISCVGGCGEVMDDIKILQCAGSQAVESDLEAGELNSVGPNMNMSRF